MSTISNGNSAITSSTAFRSGQVDWVNSFDSDRSLDHSTFDGYIGQLELNS